MTETITIKGINYEVVTDYTPKDREEALNFKMAENMRQRHQIRQIYAKRPKGKLLYFIVEFEKPYQQFSDPVRAM